MNRIALALLVACLAGGAQTAPAPPEGDAWRVGWDRPIDPLGDCRFVRAGAKLTIHVPPPSKKGSHQLRVEDGKLNAPRLLRDAEGDFLMEVRVGWVGDAEDGSWGWGAPGILLTDGMVFVTLVRQFTIWSWRGEKTTYYLNRSVRTLNAEGEDSCDSDGVPLDRPAYLRLERRGDTVRTTSSPDGKVWARWEVVKVKLARKAKVGVIAGGGSDAIRPWFDKLRFVRGGK
jgi:hypothetical protein